mmetsp:Transcript_22775/g.57392  ORF Transcript_22775/g.57392 Transcript_22775/m.57392 type:complete len:203 (-) Transcript_22775:363-971(-)
MPAFRPGSCWRGALCIGATPRGSRSLRRRAWRVRITGTTRRCGRRSFCARGRSRNLRLPSCACWRALRSGCTWTRRGRGTCSRHCASGTSGTSHWRPTPASCWSSAATLSPWKAPAVSCLPAGFRPHTAEASGCRTTMSPVITAGAHRQERMGGGPTARWKSWSSAAWREARVQVCMATRSGELGAFFGGTATPTSWNRLPH